MWGVLPLAFDYIIGWGPFAFNIGYFKGAVSQNLSISKLWEMQGAKKTIFTACHSGKLKLAFTSPDVIQLAPKTFWLAELISQFFCYSNSSKKHLLPVGQVKNRIHLPDSKIHQPRAIGHHFLCTLGRCHQIQQNKLVGYWANWIFWLHCFQELATVVHSVHCMMGLDSMPSAGSEEMSIEEQVERLFVVRNSYDV